MGKDAVDVLGHKSGALCQHYASIAERNEDKIKKDLEELGKENCSMFHYMETYHGRRKSSLSKETNSLLNKIRKNFCPITYNTLY